MSKEPSLSQSISVLPDQLQTSADDQLLILSQELRWTVSPSQARGDKCLHQLFEAQAEKSPGSVALTCEQEQLTYAELNQRANQLARHLFKLGVGPESLVGIYMERSIELVVAILGVLKAGGAYVPLDPTYPKARVAFMLEDSGVDVFLTQEQLVNRLPAHRARMVRIDADWKEIALCSIENHDAGLRASNLAYVIYTSGSTGTPKGVSVSHDSLVHLFQAISPHFDFCESDAWTMSHSYAFDFSVWDIFGALLSGGRLVIVPLSVTQSPLEYFDLLRAEQVTVLSLTPPALRQLVQTGKDPSELFLRVVIGGGDSFPLELAQELLLWNVPLWNFYGPTESTVWAAFRKVEASDLRYQTVPVGKPITDVEAYVLDEHMRLVPAGVTGELYLGGAGLARGYFRRPKLTAERFIPNPFSDVAGARLYRTGDLGRVLSNGDLEHLGRIDNQVKVRGFRIELEEIEAVLTQHPSVQQAIVVVRGDRPAEQRLVAYLVPRQSQTPKIPELLEVTRAKLPEYMIPQAWVTLTEMPLTPTGKVDRRALPAPGLSQVVGSNYMAPRNRMEEVVARIWQQVLHVERVGVEDNFFELGGHSLLATEVTSQIRDLLRVDVPLRMLFQAPSLADLAAAVTKLEAEQISEQDPAPQAMIVPAPEARHAPFPLSDIQRAYWIGRSDAFELGNVACHIYFDFACNGLDLERLTRAWQMLISRHDMLRAVVLEDGQQQILEEVPPYRIEVVDMRGTDPQVSAAQLQQVREQMSHQVHAPEQWPLFDIKAHLLNDGNMRLHVNFDLLIVDGISLIILFQEWKQLYDDPSLALAPLEFSFRDYVLAEIASHDSARYESARQYWINRLTTLPPSPELPLAKNPASVVKPRFSRQNTVLDAHTQQTVLDAETWSRLKKRGRERGLTPSVILCAAYADVLCRWSKTSRFTLNLTAFGRQLIHPQINQVVGDFTTITLLEVDGLAGTTFESRARRLQLQLWEDLDHRHFNGISVMQELARRKGLTASASMPVVFTSLLEDFSVTDWLGELTYSITNTPQVWLDHVAMERDGALAFHWDAVAELFPEGLLHDMFNAYWQLLRRLAGGDHSWTQKEHGRLPVAQLDQLSAVNHTEAPVPRGLLHQGFFEKAKLCPNQIAVITTTRQLTYEELAHRAQHVSRWLRQHGAKRNCLVGVVMEKGWEQVVAVLGILQAGAAYLPLDSELPGERLRYLLDHGEVELVLTQTWIDDCVEWPERIQRLTIDAAETEEHSDELGPGVEANQAMPADLAYVIFTSGSTGLPKGVMIEHRAALNTVVDINERFGIGPPDRVLAISSLSFDLSVYDIFGTLAAGGTIVIPDAAGTREPRHWASLVESAGVTVWNSVPALLELLIEHVESSDEKTLASLRVAMMSGDWIPVTLPDRLKVAAPGVNAVSLGGATEASIWSILHPIKKVEAHWKSIPYGKPMVNQRFYVLNEALEICAAWVPGQLHIGGIGLARGYWRDETKSTASFFEHPTIGERLYRTGDMGRYLPDGNIEFLGREDSQVKIQGNRIELGEIEAALEQHGQVRAAVVTVQGPRDGDRRLVGYIVPAQEAAPPSTGELRDYLKGKLPGYMVPSTYTLLKELPLTANGKVDRKSLPEPDAAIDSCREPSPTAAPQSSPIVVIARIAAEILKIERVEPDAKLLELGAASIDIMRLGGMLQRTFGFRPEMGQLFRLPTVRAIAEYYESSSSKNSSVAATTGAGGEAEERRVSAILGETPLLFELDQREEFKRSRPGLDGLVVGASWVDLGPAEPREDLLESYKLRRSHRNFAAQAVSREALAGLLNCLGEISLNDQPKYRYGSAGGLYPVQTYLYISENRVQEMAAGLYYYHPLKRQLGLLSEGVSLNRNIHFHYNRPIFDEAAFTILLVAQLKAIAPMYGKSSMRFSLLEAGEMTQLLEMTGPEHGLGLCQIGEVEFEEVRQLLGLEESQVLLHTLLGGVEAQAPATLETAWAEGVSEGVAAAHEVTIRPDPQRRHEPFPLLEIQQALWVGRNAHYDLGNVSAHVYFEFESTQLDLARLTHAWQRLIERHEMLRAIVLSNGQQQILEEIPAYRIEVVDLREADAQSVAAQLRTVRERMSHQVLPADRWPLFENLAHLLNDGRILLHMSLDSQFLDALSENIILSELSGFYENPDLVLPPLELSFRDYVLGAAALQQSEMYRQSRSYWLDRLQTLPPGPQLPLTQNPNSLKNPKFVRYDAALGAEEWGGLKLLCGQAGLTPSIVICAAFAAVLATWSKSQRLTLNLTLYNRFPLHPQVNDIVGQFTGVNLLEVDYSSARSFADHARQLQNQLWEDLEHRYFNGVLVLRELARFQGELPHAIMSVVLTSTLNQPARSKSGTPRQWLGELKHSITQTPQVWIEHDTNEQDGGLSFYWDCVEELFPAGFLSDMFGAYCQLLKRLASEPNLWLDQMPSLLPPAQLQQRAELCQTDAPISNELLHTLFATQVGKRGQQPAVISPQRTLCYQELFHRSNQVGHWLRHLGARPNTLVGIVVEKGWEQVVAVLGVLQSGAAYVPLDPQLPKERLWYLMQHSGVELVLTQPWLDERMDWPESVQRLCLDDAHLDVWSKQPLKAKQKPDDLAFVIYTSGSTGLPKGVMITHQGAVNAVLHTNARFAVTPEDRALAVTELHHDMSAFDVYGLLAAGGAIVIPEAKRRRDPAHWIELMGQESITIWNSVPAVMGMLVDYVEARALSSAGALRLVFLGGDWIPLDLPRRTTAMAQGAQVISVGGPTETTIWNICYPVASVDPQWKSIPYGKPLPNARYFILNEALDDCPVWVPGEMYCAGVGVAQGYWRDEEKTRARFFIHERTGERLYRTGDLGRYLPDGNIEFLGRADFQVKILGQRIELGEIELTLKQHEDVGDAVVTAAGELRGEKRLIAYYVPRTGSEPAVDDLREFLKEKLPSHMVPLVWVKLEALPLTANGKVDRRALPAPEQLPAESEKGFLAPRNPVEQQVTRICAQVLKCGSVGVYDDFFARGGNSLTAIQLISQLRSEFQVEVPLVELFDNPTMAHLAGAIMREQIEQANQEELTQALAELEHLSETEVEALLREANRSAEGEEQ